MCSMISRERRQCEDKKIPDVMMSYQLVHIFVVHEAARLCIVYRIECVNVLIPILLQCISVDDALCSCTSRGAFRALCGSLWPKHSNSVRQRLSRGTWIAFGELGASYCHQSKAMSIAFKVINVSPLHVCCATFW